MTVEDGFAAILRLPLLYLSSTDVSEDPGRMVSGARKQEWEGIFTLNSRYRDELTEGEISSRFYGEEPSART